MKKILLIAAAVVRASFENDGKSSTVVLDTYSFKAKSSIFSELERFTKLKLILEFQFSI